MKRTPDVEMLLNFGITFFMNKVYIEVWEKYVGEGKNPNDAHTELWNKIQPLMVKFINDVLELKKEAL